MTGWNIDPSGVAAVVSTTEKVIEGFTGDGNTLAGGMSDATSGCGSGGMLSANMVHAALDGFATANEKTLGAIAGRAVSSVNAAVRATQFYEQGDQQMAAHAQRAAAQAPVPQVPGAPGAGAPGKSGFVAAPAAATKAPPGRWAK